MFRIPLALFVAVVLAGCDTMPVRYVPVYYSAQQLQGRLVLPQAPTGETATATAPAPTASAPAAPAIIVQPAPQVVYIQPPVYFNPIMDIAAGYLIWRSLGGWHGGHGGHHRR